MNTKSSSAISEITPLSDKDCFYIADRIKSEFTYPIHSHSEFELNYVENARGVRRIIGDSVEVIGDYDLTLVAGEKLEHVWQQHECTSKSIREITIQFSSDLFFGNLLNKNQFDSIRKMFENAKQGVSFPMEAIMKIYPQLNSLSEEKNGFYAVIKFMTILYELSLYDNSKILSSSSFVHIDEGSDSRRISKVHEYINTHFKEPIRMEDLAALVGMSYVSFSRFFKLRTGKTVMDYILDIRIGFAIWMLVNTTNSIAEIAFECGFNNLSNFNRIFKKKKDYSPKQLRENYRKTKHII